MAARASAAQKMSSAVAISRQRHAQGDCEISALRRYRDDMDKGVTNRWTGPSCGRKPGSAVRLACPRQPRPQARRDDVGRLGYSGSSEVTVQVSRDEWLWVKRTGPGADYEGQARPVVALALLCSALLLLCEEREGRDGRA